MLDRSGRPERSGPERFVRRLQANESIACVILSERIEDYWTHWDGDTTIPCITPHSSCPGHKRNLPRRYKGYLHVWDSRLRAEQFLELTPVAAECVVKEHPLGE